jgi:hypothetical protein
VTTIRYGIPGIGGSLGSCAVCGDTFLYEILMGQRIDSLKLAGIDKNLPVHKKCVEKVIALQGPWEEIRDKFPDGPIKKAFEEEHNMRASRDSSGEKG